MIAAASAACAAAAAAAACGAAALRRRRRGQKLEVLAEVYAASERLDRLKETGGGKEREGWAELQTGELRKIKEGLDAELAEAEARRGAGEAETRRMSRVRTLTAEQVSALSATATPSAPPLEPLVLLGLGVVGLRWNNTWIGDPAGPGDERRRDQVRRNTRDKVRNELGLTFFGECADRAKKMPPQMGSSYLFRDVSKAAQEGLAPAGGYNLLGRYDVCCVKTRADLDRKWKFEKGSKEFWVAHAAAVNIGETVDARDFCDFRKLGNDAAKTLDERKYVEAMGHIMDNIVNVCSELQIEQMVFFPFGMGAFLRNLGRIDPNFLREEEILSLRRALAARMVESWAGLPKGLTVHLCLQFASDEAQRNADAFLRAVLGNAGSGNDASVMKDSVMIIPEGDALNVASDLARKSDKVLLVNGANRQLIGNHWFAGRAKMAIDENLHRRSWRLSALAYMLNGYDGEQDRSQRDRDTLARRVKQLGGTVVDLQGKSFSNSDR